MSLQYYTSLFQEESHDECQNLVPVSTIHEPSINHSTSISGFGPPKYYQEQSSDHFFFNKVSPHYNLPETPSRWDMIDTEPTTHNDINDEFWKTKKYHYIVRYSTYADIPENWTLLIPTHPIYIVGHRPEDKEFSFGVGEIGLNVYMRRKGSSLEFYYDIKGQIKTQPRVVYGVRCKVSTDITVGMKR